MVTHLFLFRFGDVSDATRVEALRAIEGLRDEIDVIRSLEVGRDFLRSPLSYDVGVTVTFADRAALLEYQDHPRHREVVGHLRAVARDVAIVDYEP
ncbi:MAG: Dabb family protein [Myxococcota bacterium]